MKLNVLVIIMTTVSLAFSQYDGYVVDDLFNLPIESAIVTMDGRSVSTDSNGYYIFDVPLSISNDLNHKYRYGKISTFDLLGRIKNRNKSFQIYSKDFFVMSKTNSGQLNIWKEGYDSLVTSIQDTVKLSKIQLNSSDLFHLSLNDAILKDIGVFYGEVPFDSSLLLLDDNVSPYLVIDSITISGNPNVDSLTYLYKREIDVSDDYCFDDVLAYYYHEGRSSLYYYFQQQENYLNQCSVGFKNTIKKSVFKEYLNRVFNHWYKRQEEYHASTNHFGYFSDILHPVYGVLGNETTTVDIVNSAKITIELFMPFDYCESNTFSVSIDYESNLTIEEPTNCKGWIEISPIN